MDADSWGGGGGVIEEGEGVIGEGHDTGDSVDADPSIVAIGIRLAWSIYSTDRETANRSTLTPYDNR